MGVDQILNKIEAVDASLVEITAQDVAGGEEFEEPSDDDSSEDSSQGISLEKFDLNFKILGKIKEESIDIKSEPEDEPVVQITAQDVAGGEDEEFKEAGEDDSQGRRKKPKIQADNQSEASVFYDALHGNESLVINFNSEKSETVESEPERSTLYKTQNGTRLDGEKDKPQLIRQPLSNFRVSPSEYTILESKRVQCNHCSINLKHVWHILRHIRQSHRDTTNLYKCPFCPYTSKYYTSVTVHIINKHKSNNELTYFECHTCGKRFKLKSILVRHMISHRTKKEMMRTNEMHKCPECDRLYRYKESLYAHIKNSHRETHEKMQCYNCFYRCKSKQHLIFHIQKCHTPPERLKTLKCPKCNFTTKFDADLKYHKWVNHKFTKRHSPRAGKIQ